MSFNKNLQKLLAEPTEMRIGEIINILDHFGFRLRRINGSHYQFRKEKIARLTIAVHNRKVKIIYLKLVKQTIIPLLQ